MYSQAVLVSVPGHEDDLPVARGPGQPGLVGRERDGPALAAVGAGVGVPTRHQLPYEPGLRSWGGGVIS